MEKLKEMTGSASGCARTIGEMLLEVGRMDSRAAELIEQDLGNPEMSLEKCSNALREHARKNQKGSCWSCAVFRIYKIPAEWLTASAAPEPAKPAPAGGRIDLLDLL